MPPRKKLKTSHTARKGQVYPDGDTDGDFETTVAPLPTSYPEAVRQLVDQVSVAVRQNCAMFKVEVASGTAEDLQRTMAERADTAHAVPLCEVTERQVPAADAQFMVRRYAEALQQAVRAHFAFVEQDTRLMWGGVGLSVDASSATWLVYLYIYSSLTRYPGQQPTAASPMEMQRRRTQPSASASSAIEEELSKFKDSLDRAEQELLNVSGSAAELRLPATPPLEVSLPVLPRRSLGTALPSVLPSVAAGRHGTAAAASPAQLPRKRPRAISPAGRDPDMDTSDNNFVSSRVGDYRSDGAAAVSPTSPSTPSKGAALSDQESAQLTDFFFSLNGSQSEQARVSLTCRYAKLRYGRDVSSGAVYRLVERCGRTAAPPSLALSEQQQHDTALRVFSELDGGQTEQSRVAYTLQYMRVQHGCRITANQLFGWLGQGSKKPAKLRR